MKSKGKGGREKRNKEGLIRLNGHSSQEKGRATRRGGEGGWTDRPKKESWKKEAKRGREKVSLPLESSVWLPGREGKAAAGVGEEEMPLRAIPTHRTTRRRRRRRRDSPPQKKGSSVRYREGG